MTEYRDSYTPTRHMMAGRAKVIVLVIVAGVVVALIWFLSSSSNKVRSARMRLVWNRAMIQQFYKGEGRYPSSLTELDRYYASKDAAKRRVCREEYLSSSEGVTKEYGVLNGKGGWYYDSTTGDLKINLTKPVKNYVGSYWGSDRNEPPAEW